MLFHFMRARDLLDDVLAVLSPLALYSTTSFSLPRPVHFAESADDLASELEAEK